MITAFWSGDRLVEMSFTKHDSIAMHAELTATRERVHKRILVEKIAVSHRLDQMNNFRLLEELAAWKRTNGFDRSEVLAERRSAEFRGMNVRSMVRNTPKLKYILTRDG